MEDWMESSLEEKVDIENLELLTFDPNTNKDLTFKHQIKCKKEEEPLNSSDVNLLAENHEKENIVKEPENDREYTNSGISSNENEKCQICGLEFGNKAVLNIHTSVVHPKEAKKIKNEIVKEKALYKCSVCTYKAKNRTSLKIHIGKVHERKRNHECSICHAQYSAKSNLKTHIETIHEGKKGQQCSLCDASFTNKRNLDDHVQVVHEGKKFECTLCDQGKYSQRRNLNLHIQRIHEGIENKYACTICSYSFNSNALLKRHVDSVHEGKKPIRCDICDAKFAEKSTLKSHIKLIHENPKHFDDTKKVVHCKRCPASFTCNTTKMPY